jgi:hypothetical protein
VKRRDAVEIAIALRHALLRRGVGHTTALLEGAIRSDCFVVVANMQEVSRFKYLRDSRAQTLGDHIHSRQCVSLENIRRDLQGISKPVLVDHYALTRLLDGMLIGDDHGN